MDYYHHTNSNADSKLQTEVVDNTKDHKSLIVWPFVAECLVLGFKTPEELLRAQTISDTINITHFKPNIATDWRTTSLIFWDPLYTSPEWMINSHFLVPESIKAVQVKTLAKEVQISLVQSLLLMTEHRQSSQPQSATRPVYESYENDETGITIEMKGNEIVGFVWSVTNAHKNLPPGARI